jgi:PAS domain-containing protein
LKDFLGSTVCFATATGIHWFELSIAPMLDSQDDVLHFICLSRDITKAKQADFAYLKVKSDTAVY